MGDRKEVVWGGLILLALAACGGTGESAQTGAVANSAAGGVAMGNEWDLTIEAQFLVDESLSTQLELHARRLRGFRYERRGDVGDGTEEVVSCTGTLPDAEHQALVTALDLPSGPRRRPVRFV